MSYGRSGDSHAEHGAAEVGHYLSSKMTTVTRRTGQRPVISQRVRDLSGRRKPAAAW